MKEKISKLIDLKSIITILITGCLIYGFVVDKINNEQFMTIATMIFTFYFAKRKGDDTMATTDTRSVEEIKEDIIKVETPIEEEVKEEN